MSMNSPTTAGFRLTGRHVLVLMLAFFGLIFAANAALISLAVGTFSGLEVASSYRAGRGFPAEIEAARAQAALGWTVSAHVERNADGTALIRFEPRDARHAIAGLDVVARLQRPTDSRFDRTADLDERTPGVYLARVAGVEQGQWTLVFEARRGTERIYRSRNRVVLP